jgi:hypothetical protein
MYYFLFLLDLIILLNFIAIFNLINHFIINSMMFDFMVITMIYYYDLFMIITRSWLSHINFDSIINSY